VGPAVEPMYCRLMNDKELRTSFQAYGLGAVIRGMARMSAMAGLFLASHQPAWTADLVPPPPPDVPDAPDTPPSVIPLPAPPNITPEMRTQPEAIPRPNHGVPPGQPVPEMPFDQKLGQKNAPPPTAPPARPIPDPPHAPAFSP
jgi:hypothetical protein